MHTYNFALFPKPIKTRVKGFRVTEFHKDGGKGEDTTAIKIWNLESRWTSGKLTWQS